VAQSPPASAAIRPASAFKAIAADIGLDLARWRADAASSGVAENVDADRSAAEGMSLSGTPTIFVDGVQYRGPLSRDGLVAAIEAAAGD
jgi:predicted DsbA family dithiol-disulfide isomerase